MAGSEVSRGHLFENRVTQRLVRYQLLEPCVLPLELLEPLGLVQPQLPSVPPRHLTVDQLGVLDLIISKTGEVEHVKLISIANRFQERMIVAAAKAWRFRPALKDGQPVKSRIRVRVTL